MNVAVSHIAWPLECERTAAELLASHGIPGVEVAPTKVWPKPLDATQPELAAYRRFWESFGIRIVAIQSLLFGRDDLELFGTREQRRLTFTQLSGMMRVAAALGARALVFGSPKNRRLNGLSVESANRIAVDFFSLAGEVAAGYGVILCIEPNPSQYGCEYVTTSAEALQLVNRVNRPGFGLHLDTACLSLSEEPLPQAIHHCVDSIAHFHASEPHLSLLGHGGVDHPQAASLLRQADYRHWVSAEMRYTSGAPVESFLPPVLAYLQSVYGSDS